MKINWLTFISRHWNIATDHGMEYGPWAGYEALVSEHYVSIMYLLCAGMSALWRLWRLLTDPVHPAAVLHTTHIIHIQKQTCKQCFSTFNVRICAYLLVPKLFFHVGVGRAFHTIRIYSYPTFSQTLFISTWMNLNRLSAKIFSDLDMIYSFNWHCWNPKIVKHHLPYMSDMYRAQIQNVSASGI